ncbi:uncharacterized protein LOC133909851 [Phragmites australis]|uniref:uncharacterized protein LOC133909851 n=1 Tax=Phragmites australis TaxID=29695 RepID=UPI002D79D220|nr:uncharacterized protein LOC133909851 [Phragmites australis]
MASIVLLLSELLGGESASVLAANRYMGGHSLREFRPAVTEASAKVGARPAGADHAAAAGTGREEKRKEESFEDLLVSRIAVDVMWP